MRSGPEAVSLCGYAALGAGGAGLSCAVCTRRVACNTTDGEESPGSTPRGGGGGQRRRPCPLSSATWKAHDCAASVYGERPLTLALEVGQRAPRLRALEQRPLRLPPPPARRRLFGVRRHQLPAQAAQVGLEARALRARGERCGGRRVEPASRVQRGLRSTAECGGVRRSTAEYRGAAECGGVRLTDASPPSCKFGRAKTSSASRRVELEGGGLPENGFMSSE